jgi:hypothetical protein
MQAHPATDEARQKLGFLTVAQTIALAAEKQVIILDPSSVLVSPGVSFGAGVTIWPNVTLLCREEGRIGIGTKAVLFSGTRMVVEGGEIVIGRETEIGDEGGFTFQVFASSQHITIGDNARLLGGGALAQSNDIGSGAQILGPIRGQNCRLGGGGSYRHPDPDERGGVLKGAGVARDIEVPAGKVIQAFGLFADAPLRPQSFFHPKT